MRNRLGGAESVKFDAARDFGVALAARVSEQGVPPPPRFSHAPGAAKTKSTTIAAMDDMEA